MTPNAEGHNGVCFSQKMGQNGKMGDRDALPLWRVH
jgi:hypothetical protein